MPPESYERAEGDQCEAGCGKARKFLPRLRQSFCNNCRKRLIRVKSNALRAKHARDTWLARIWLATKVMRTRAG